MPGPSLLRPGSDLNLWLALTLTERSLLKEPLAIQGQAHAGGSQAYSKISHWAGLRRDGCCQSSSLGPAPGISSARGECGHLKLHLQHKSRNCQETMHVMTVIISRKIEACKMQLSGGESLHEHMIRVLGGEM